MFKPRHRRRRHTWAEKSPGRKFRGENERGAPSSERRGATTGTEDHEIDPAILGPRRIAAFLLGFEAALGDGLEPGGIHADRSEIGPGGIRATLTEAQIVIGGTAPVAMAL